MPVSGKRYLAGLVVPEVAMRLARRVAGSRLSLSSLLLAAAVLSCGPARAGRPMSVDDAATADRGQCQAEAWHERKASRRGEVLALACGLADGLEAGFSLSRQRGGDDGPSNGREPGLKWVPAAARAATAAGELAFGLHGSAHLARTPGCDEAPCAWQLLGIASLSPSDAWSLHLNLGVAHDRAARVGAGNGGLAVVWTPSAAGLLFAEVQGSRRSDVFGPVVRTAGGRWWLTRDRLGIDLTASRDGGGGANRWTLGFGAYGFAL